MVYENLTVALKKGINAIIQLGDIDLHLLYSFKIFAMNIFISPRLLNFLNARWGQLEKLSIMLLYNAKWWGESIVHFVV